MKRAVAKEETIEIQKAAGGSGGKLGAYLDLILGRRSLSGLLKFELVTGLLANLPGAAGIVLRSKFYRGLLGQMGRNVTFGRGVTLRHPHKIFIGDNVVIDDGVLLDAKGQDNRGIMIGNGVFIGRNTLLNCKNGDIILEDRANLSSYVHIFSASEVRVGAAALVASYVYLVGGTHHFADPLVPVLDQGRESRGIAVGPGGWIGAHVTVFDGVTIGRHAVIGANSAVSRRIPKYAVAAGSPIEIINRRRPEEPVPQRPSVTVGIVNYNGAPYLESVIDTVLAQDYENILSIVLVDNSSTDGSVALLREKYPSVSIVSMENRGPNPSRNQLLRNADSDFVLLMDNDIDLAPDVVSELVAAMEKQPEAGIASAQIRWAHRRDVVQYNGVDIHFAGGAVMNRLDIDNPVTVGAVPAGVQLVHRERALEIGLFDEDYFYGWADGDFAYRMTISGYPCLNVARARVYHKKEKTGSPWTFYQVRNRWWFMLKIYHWRTLFVLLPAILLNQLAIFVFCLMKGQAGAFFKGSLAVWGSLPAVMKKRRAVMALKTEKDRKHLTAVSMDMLGDAGGSMVLRAGSGVLNGVFKLYWLIARWLIK